MNLKAFLLVRRKSRKILNEKSLLFFSESFQYWLKYVYYFRFFILIEYSLVDYNCRNSNLSKKAKYKLFTFLSTAKESEKFQWLSKIIYKFYNCSGLCVIKKKTSKVYSNSRSFRYDEIVFWIRHTKLNLSLLT